MVYIVILCSRGDKDDDNDHDDDDDDDSDNGYNPRTWAGAPAGTSWPPSAPS